MRLYHHFEARRDDDYDGDGDGDHDSRDFGCGRRLRDGGGAAAGGGNDECRRHR